MTVRAHKPRNCTVSYARYTRQRIIYVYEGRSVKEVYAGVLHEKDAIPRWMVKNLLTAVFGTYAQVVTVYRNAWHTKPIGATEKMRHRSQLLLDRYLNILRRIIQARWPSTRRLRMGIDTPGRKLMRKSRLIFIQQGAPVRRSPAWRI